MKLSMIIEAQDRASRPVERVEDAVGGLGRTIRGTGSEVGRLDRRMGAMTYQAHGASAELRRLNQIGVAVARSTGRMNQGMVRTTRSAGRLERGARRVGAGLAGMSRRGIRALDGLVRRFDITNERMEKLAFSTGTLIGTTIRGAVVGGGALAGTGAIAALYKVATAGMEMEGFRTQLEGLEGSSAAADRALQWVAKFAARTPYEMNEVMEAFIALKAYGIDPTSGSLRTLGDAAAGMNRPIMDAVEMMADAVTGEYERLKSFGIRASVAGDKVTLRWTRNSKELSKTVKASSTEIQRALSQILDERFAGGMDRRAKITAGKISNIWDFVNRQAARVWEGGLGKEVNRQFDRLLGTIDRMEKDGSLQAWADKTGAGLGDLVATIGSADWPQIGRDFVTVAGGVRDLANAIIYLSRKAREAGRIDMTPLLPLPLQMTRRALDGWQAYQHARNAPPRASAAMPANRQPLAPLRRDRLLPQPARPTRQSPLLPGQAPVKWPSPPTGKMEISVKTDAGTTARVTKVASTNLDLDVNTGRAMGAFA
ncbi:tape measure protein [Sphingobium ummariense]|uniref:Uncharacterized protein n=1 Tax=Sphingobium ummariense RL-3 TaxID=1346791 RepID=T0K5M0_9SPHN|nr:tape measure protein [Sphingobium ummariense]EQB31969.1 hypothetical protein M529_11950 [Sphingobium ummariense RL-3]